MIYITYADLYSTGYCGVTKKIMSQIKVFQRCFGRVYYTTYSGKMIYLMNERQVVDKQIAITRAMYNHILNTWLDKYNIHRTYVRYSYSDKWFISLLRQQKEKDIKSVLEIPTYPYDGEIENERIKIEDQYYRTQLCQYIEWVATNSSAQEIWGMSCIQLLNGVDLKANPPHLKEIEKKKIVLLGVSSMAIWHGYERILQGLFNYYKSGGNYDFRFIMVGIGPETEKYHSLTLEYGLQSRVDFCGMLEGEELNKQYAMADIAVSSLGLYKTGIQDVTPIKGAEYCARGIPFICGYHDMRFPDKVDYIMNVPNNQEPINMNEVIAFYKNITAQDNFQRKMREYALKHFTWESIMEPIVEVLK